MEMEEIRERRKGQILMLICSVLWSISGIMIKYISWSPFLIAGVRSLISAGVIAIYMRATGKKISVCKKSLEIGVCLCGCVTCFVIANKMTTAANAIVLQYIAPAFVLMISYFVLKQKLEKMEIAVVLLTFGGIILFFMDELKLGNIMGNIIAIISGLFMAIMFVLNGDADIDTKTTGILSAHLLTALIGIPVGAFMTAAAPQPMEILLIIILGVVQLGIPYVLYAQASSLISPLSCSLIGMIEPLLNPLWVAVFYGEVPGIYALFGGIIVIASVVVYNIWSDSIKKQEKTQK